MSMEPIILDISDRGKKHAFAKLPMLDLVLQHLKALEASTLELGETLIGLVSADIKSQIMDAMNDIKAKLDDTITAYSS